MRSKDHRPLTQDETIQKIVAQDYSPVSESPLMFDPAELDDQEHLELLEESHGYACVQHRLSELAVDANYRALDCVKVQNPLASAWAAGFFHGIRTAMQTRALLLAEATGDQKFRMSTDPGIAEFPPRVGSKAVAAQKPTLRKKPKRSPRRKSA